MQRQPIRIALSLLGAAPCWFQPATAETTAQFQVAATITAGCLVSGLGGSGSASAVGLLDFGEDSTFSMATHTASLGGSQSITLRCTPGANVTMSIDGGHHAAAGSRHLQLGGNNAARIAYVVCSDATCNQPVAIGAGTAMVVTSGNSNDVHLPVYGRLMLPGGLPAGDYTDTLTVTLQW
ncbi:spore coat protein U-like protein [Sphingobium sp. B11D3B]|uniref:Csu type fimbrial protein n=1 Tax=unclassified Sphingobium TaxID=2611147 RepID=UPI00222555D9|nr:MULTISPECIES: spore coat U domain-containing protein [unclassified Sphingobium]MCW2365144.1 spore coat protein U-like protein [Sphingobium sp. B7D2B]MCW2389221.1 spore coat protein U-like protein [Sphingobium sp. B11D3B]